MKISRQSKHSEQRAWKWEVYSIPRTACGSQGRGGIQIGQLHSQVKHGLVGQSQESGLSTGS